MDKRKEVFKKMQDSPSQQIENRTSCCTNSGGNIIGDYEDYILGYTDVMNSYGLSGA